MFGLIEGQRLCGGVRRTFSHHLCATCEALGDSYGLLARAAISTDAALLSLLVSAQGNPGGGGCAGATCGDRCPLRQPWRIVTDSPAARYLHRRRIQTDPGPQFAAAISLAMLAVRLDDALADGDLPRVLRPLGRRLLARLGSAEQTLVWLGFPAPEIAAAVARQRAAEALPGQEFAAYSVATEAVAGLAFRHTATLAGRPENGAALETAGQAYGRLIYLVDAARDLAADRRRGHFNPFAHLAPAAVPDRVRDLATAAEATLRRAMAAVAWADPALPRHLFSTLIPGVVEARLAPVGMGRWKNTPGVDLGKGAAPAKEGGAPAPGEPEGLPPTGPTGPKEKKKAGDSCCDGCCECGACCDACSGCSCDACSGCCDCGACDCSC
jgi:hypothetical protein